MFTNKINRIERSKPTLLFIAFFLLIFVSSLSGTRAALETADLIMNYEFIFIALYLVIERKDLGTLFSINDNRLITSLFFIWMISVLLSFYLSPYNLNEKPQAVLRLVQTFMHVGLFFIVRDYLIHYNPDINKILSSIYIGIVITIFVFIYNLYGTQLAYESREWFVNPILNSHIRHTGYQATAAVALSMVLILSYHSKKQLLLIYCLNIATWSFLFWLGGRGSILSIWMTALILILILKYLNIRLLPYLKHVIIFSLLGIFIAEIFAIFQWNGILQSFERTTSPETVNRLTSGRLEIWIRVIESMKDQTLLGLGSQSFYYRPNRIWEIVQPHSVVFQFWIEWGIIGGISFLALLSIGFYNGIKRHILNINKSSPNIGRLSAGSIIIALTLHAITDGTYYHPQPSLYLVIAFAIWTTPSSKKAISIKD